MSEYARRPVTIARPNGVIRMIRLHTDGTHVYRKGVELPLSRAYPGCNIAVDMTYSTHAERIFDPLKPWRTK